MVFWADCLSAGSGTAIACAGITACVVRGGDSAAMVRIRHFGCALPLYFLIFHVAYRGIAFWLSGILMPTEGVWFILFSR